MHKCDLSSFVLQSTLIESENLTTDIIFELHMTIIRIRIPLKFKMSASKTISSINEIPDHLLSRFAEYMDVDALAIASCLNKSFKDVCSNALNDDVNTFDKIMTVLQDVLFRPSEFWYDINQTKTKATQVHICLMDGSGRVRCWIMRRSFDTLPCYKLDGRHDTPSFTLNKKQMDVFKGYIANEIEDITKITLYTSMRRLERAAPIKILQRRLQAVFPKEEINVFNDAYLHTL